MKILKRFLMAAAIVGLTAGPVLAANQTLTEALGTVKIIDTPMYTEIRLVPASLAAAAADTAFAVLDIAKYLKATANSSGAPIYNATIAAWGWATGVDSLKTAIRFGQGATTTGAGWKTIYTEANINSNLQRPTSPTNDKIATKTLTLTTADIDRWLQVKLMNVDATSAGVVVFAIRFHKVKFPAI